MGDFPGEGEWQEGVGDSMMEGKMEAEHRGEENTKEGEKMEED